VVKGRECEPAQEAFDDARTIGWNGERADMVTEQCPKILCKRIDKFE
jgi:hypothetical protein